MAKAGYAFKSWRGRAVQGAEGHDVSKFWRKCRQGRAPLTTTVMRHGAVALILALAAGVGHGQATPAELTKAQAKRIALTAAGCRKPEDCIASGRLDHDNWVFVIVFIEGRDAAGDFPTKSNGWTQVTVDSRGHVIGKLLGN